MDPCNLRIIPGELYQNVRVIRLQWVESDGCYWKQQSCATVRETAVLAKMYAKASPIASSGLSHWMTRSYLGDLAEAATPDYLRHAKKKRTFCGRSDCAKEPISDLLMLTAPQRETIKSASHQLDKTQDTAKTTPGIGAAKVTCKQG